MCFRGKLRGNRFEHYSKTELFKYKNCCKKVKVLYLRINKALSLARKEGFEPSRRFYPAYSLSRGAPSATWVLPQAGDKAGGESGIRTHGCFHIAGFQDRCFRPLSHLSVRKSKPLPEADMILSSPEPFVNTKYTLPVKKRGRSHAAAPSRHRQSGVTTPDSSPSPC